MIRKVLTGVLILIGTAMIGRSYPCDTLDKSTLKDVRLDDLNSIDVLLRSGRFGDSCQISETAYSWIKQGNLSSRKSDWNEAYTYYKAALILFEEVKEYGGMGNCYLNFGRAEMENSKRRHYYFKALEYFKLAQMDASISRCINNIGVSFEEEDQLDSAMYYFLEGMKGIGNHGQEEVRGAYFVNIGTVLRKKKEYEGARKYIDSASQIFEEINNAAGLAYTYGQQAQISFDLGDMHQAMNYALKGNAIAIEKGYLNEALETSKLIQSIYKEKGDYQNALEYAEAGRILLDSINSKSRKTHADLFKFELDSFRKTKTIELLEYEEKLRKLWNKVLVFALIGVAGLGVFIVYHFKEKVATNQRLNLQKEEMNKLKAVQMQSEIEHQKKELDQLSNYVLKKKEFVDRIKDELLSLRNLPHSPEVMKRINQTFVSLNNHLNMSSDIESLMLEMESIQKNYIQDLKIKFPKLTNNDIQLISFLALGLSSKDIASMIGISVESVHTKRYRLRKKLELNKEDSLESFISDFNTS